MPMSSNKDSSMFPEFDFDYAAYRDECIQDYGVRPRPRWITTEFGGHVSSAALLAERTQSIRICNAFLANLFWYSLVETVDSAFKNTIQNDRMVLTSIKKA